MKKVLLLSSVIIILGLTGCSNKYFNDWFSSEQNETDKMCQQIIEACKQLRAVSKVLRAIVHHQVKATMVKGKRNWMVCISY